MGLSNLITLYVSRLRCSSTGGGLYVQKSRTLDFVVNKNPNAKVNNLA